MKRLSKLLSVAFALSLMTSGVASAAPAKATRGASKAKVTAKAKSAKQQSAKLAPRKQITSQQAAAKIRAKLGVKASQVKIRKSQDHAKMSEYVVTFKGKNGFTKMQVAKDGSMVRQAGGKTTQKQADRAAFQAARRERGPNKGSYSGVVRKGGSDSGKTIVYGSKTDRNQRIEVDANNPKNVRSVETRAKRQAPARRKAAASNAKAQQAPAKKAAKAQQAKVAQASQAGKGAKRSRN